MTAAEFPQPSTEALAVSAELAKRVGALIDSAGGWIRFDQYMDQALYAPGLGYYSAGSTKFGGDGDFVTAPELGSFLARALAGQFAELLATLNAPVIMELGAGSGKLAEQLLDALAEFGLAEIPYRILETSADLRARQQQLLQRFGDRVQWPARLPDSQFEGVLVANEVADALPVVRFVKRAGQAVPIGVARHEQGFGWVLGAEDDALTEAVASLEHKLGEPLADDYRSEICLLLPAWIDSLAATVSRGALLLIDYGLVRREYYHSQRRDGTLICHYRHRAHDDPFYLPGLQDISAWVDFSACADAAQRAGLEVSGFTTQGLYLAASSTLMHSVTQSLDQQALSALKTLMLPGEMGERFKLLLLTKRCESLRLPGRDFRNRL